MPEMINQTYDEFIADCTDTDWCVHDDDKCQACYQSYLALDRSDYIA